VKKNIAILLLSTFFMQQFYVAGITVWFYANRVYSERQLCINKAKPELDCRGMCVLTKKLKEAEREQQQQAPLQQKQIKESVPCLLTNASFSIVALRQITLKLPAAIVTYSYLFSGFVLHPPAIFC
jgi:hypothetical protein